MTPLELLAERAGIELEFIDARGDTQKATQEAQRSLLEAVGLKAQDEAEAAALVESLDNAAWQRALEPVVVSHLSKGPVRTVVTLPLGQDSVEWCVALEDAGRINGRSVFADLALLERKEIDGQTYERRELVLGGSLPIGYHRLDLQPGSASAALIVSPGQCWLPRRVADGDRIWGVTAQLYLLRSSGNWGIGDFSDLRRLVQMMADRGADVIGLNPLHAMFLDDPEHASPYSPASRLLLNDLNIDVASLPELRSSEDAQRLIGSENFQAKLEACRAALLVDYTTVAKLKVPVLQLLFKTFQAGAEPGRRQSFEAFRRDRGDVLERNCLFQALRQHFAERDGHRADWHSWPEEYRTPESEAVARFAADERDLVTFRVWLQWLADEQLEGAAAEGSQMAVGLYRDLAVGADPSGAETWASQNAIIADAQIGAPPDIYNPAGQDWGLPPFNPVALREEAYRSFIDLVRANMRHAGGLRIDHVMALQHAYCVPKGRSPAEGAYLRYPLEDLVGILALESQRNKCLVVGEDLGTVPEGFRERMASANILSYRVLIFEKDENGFIPPARYPALSLAVAGNHDLPTLHGWWEARDLALKDRLNLFPTPEEATRIREERESDHKQMAVALRREGLLAEGQEIDVETLISAAHTFLARSQAIIAMAQIDDLTDEAEPVNVPTTSDEHPNWRRRLSLSLDKLAIHPRLEAVASTFRGERTRVATNLNMSFTPEDRQAEMKEDIGLIDYVSGRLPSYLVEQRWYPAKDAGQPVVSLERLVAFPLPNLDAYIAIWSAEPPGQEKLRLFLPIALLASKADNGPSIGRLPSGQAIVDAFQDDAFVEAWVRVILGRDQTPKHVFAGSTVQGRESELKEDVTWTVRRSEVQQSNTSIRIGGAAILKVIRKLQSGVHPEVEMGRFLTEVAPFEATPALLGWIEIDCTTLSVLQAFAENEGDGFEWVTARLTSKAAAARALVWIRRLAERTAEMHRALASTTEDPAFQAEKITEQDLARWRAGVRASAERVVQGLESLNPDVNALTQVAVRALLEQQERLMLRIEQLLPSFVTASKTRHHGDFHLGQVLVKDGDAIIVDFEGEPMRELAERRSKHSPLRDVAGMLRSLDYAVATARSASVNSIGLDKLHLNAWIGEATATYLDGYLSSAEGTPGCPAERADALRLITFFTLEKALYEVLYELANRPEWVGIPLQGVLALLKDQRS
jgi:4-alpha-glucanotransferase